ncbi:TIGR03790 family protein [Massilia brevitalea]|uniref:TIGR03790 family protein n=1 Tax=Massilia brevitalea TaxID=442526 RepID=UPI002739CC0E|nr:TIGR03790 family protein [Massilia brevitalea]
MARLLRTAQLLLFLVLHGAALAQAPSFDTGALGPAQLAIVVNDADPASVAVAAYYRERRGIPAANVVHVRIPGKPRSLEPARFRLLKEEIDSQLGPGIEAVLMVWTAPYAVACNSITGAYTLGFDAALCRDTCAAGQPSAYFNAPSRRPFTSHGMRLAMLLPTESVAAAREVVDRGVTSGFRPVPAGAYYLTTGETARNSRAAFFPPAGRLVAKQLDVKRLQAEALENARDVMLYQLGTASVDKLETLHFLPGALADHLTSYGGDLLGSRQMSSLRWLDAGATASYGTVSEPCSHWQKFPNPAVLLRHYLRGDSAIEAYWKSVAWPAHGLFIGEPLAAPYRRR